MPQALAESFVVIFDDADRYTVSTTIRAFDSALKDAGVTFVYFEAHGVKSQAVFCSTDYTFLRSV